MKNTLHMEPPEDSAARRIESNVGRTHRLEARLAPSRGCRARGLIEYSVNVENGAYWLEAEVTIPFEDFEVLGVDPDGGFDDEKVLLTIGTSALRLELEPARITNAGVVFMASDVGTGLLLHRGDEVVLDVHAKKAASGSF